MSAMRLSVCLSRPVTGQTADITAPVPGPFPLLCVCAHVLFQDIDDEVRRHGNNRVVFMGLRPFEPAGRVPLLNKRSEYCVPIFKRHDLILGLLSTTYTDVSVDLRNWLGPCSIVSCRASVVGIFVETVSKRHSR